ncbi:MAG: hypothetical protein GEU79_03510 [Acidimicrobiia bacterium]|nr:hypothetical protein [Acidimicrobiia bacterium]
MRRVLGLVLGMMLLNVFAVPVLGATEVTVSVLIDFGAEWAGEEVVVRGELVGDYGFRGDGWMWTQLNGDAYVSQPIGDGGRPQGGNSGVGIRMPNEMGRGLDPPGGYLRRGPVVKATGVWKWHDPSRQGESYLEVSSLEVIEEGYEMDEGVDWGVIVVGAGLILLCPILWPRRRHEVSESE